MREGMNKLCKNMDITVQTDPSTFRPEINKFGSHQDLLQRKTGSYVSKSNPTNIFDDQFLVNDSETLV